MAVYECKERKNYSIYKWIYTTQDLEDFIYVGNTSNITKRKAHHKSCCNNINAKAYNKELYKKMREYGFNNFKMVILATAENITKREAEQLEEEYRVAEKANLNMKRCYRTIEQTTIDRQEQAREYKEKQEHLEEVKSYILSKNTNHENKEERYIKAREYAKNIQAEYIKKIELF